MIRFGGRPLLVVALGAALAPVARAQNTVPVDRIVAVVGSQPILSSQLEEELAQAQASGQTLPQDSAGRAALRRRILNNLVETELLVQQAEHDTTVKVTEQEVQDAVEQTVRNVRGRFASETEFQQQLRLAAFGGVEEWRRWLAENQRREILRTRLLENLRQKEKIKPIQPTDAQMRAYWEENRGQTQQRPANVSFRQIVILPKPDSAARARARATAESLIVELRHGADFADLARRLSADTTTRDSGGSLGWFRRGSMVKAFEETAFRLKPGEISDAVETDFGFHIIQVQRVQPAEVLARHILIAPVVSPAQIEATRRLADSVHAALARGASFDSLAQRYGDENVPKLAEGVAIAQLGPEYQRLFGTDSTTGLKPVLEVGAAGARPQFVVLEVTARQAEGEVAFDDVRDQIRSQLAQELGVRHYVDQLRRQTYIDIRL
ncbi:MAG TPA: peptidylprolyl isomerase [Gemmatimonadales bacterium]|nr:peptidylprolyl isomerase [Gemmatimonadales bacterium]